MGNQIIPIAFGLGGMYLILKYGLPEIWEKINPIPPIPPIQPPSASLTLSKSRVTYNETFEVSVVGLKAHTPAYYGWLSQQGTIIFEKRIEIFNLLGVRIPYNVREQVIATTPIGHHSIYFDQSPFGGYYLSKELEVYQ